MKLGRARRPQKRDQCINCGEPIVPCAFKGCVREPAWVHDNDRRSHRCPTAQDAWPLWQKLATPRSAA